MKFEVGDEVQVTLYEGANGIWVYPTEYYANKNAESLVMRRTIEEVLPNKGYKVIGGRNIIPIYREKDYILLNKGNENG